MVHIARELSPALMWLAMTIVVVYCVLGGAALVGWLPMKAPQISEESSPPAQGGKIKHATALALASYHTTTVSMHRI